MILRSQKELENTRKKLRMLEEQYEAARQETGRDEYVRDVELQSLKGLINQLKEEIARFECRTTGANPNNET
jgi:flagellar biosynthesis chaperone FliJ